MHFRDHFSSLFCKINLEYLERALYTTVWNGFVKRCCNARVVIAAVYEMLLLLSVTLPLNSCHAHVDSSDNYTHALTVVTRLYFSVQSLGTRLIIILTLHLSFHFLDSDKTIAEIEIRASTTVVQRLRDLESSLAEMQIDLLDLLARYKCDLSKAQFFLDDILDTDKFSQCTSFSEILRQLRRGHVSTFNTYYLQRFVAYLKEDEITKHIKEYEEKKNDFLKDTTVLSFQRAVVSKVKPVKPGQMKRLTINISGTLGNKRNLKDIEELALNAFDENSRSLVCIHATCV